MLGNKTSKYKLFLCVMIFSFVWVIIGDLVAMHIKVIHDVDINRSPFSKTQKPDSKIYKSQKSKIFDDNTFLGLAFVVSAPKTLAYFNNSEQIIRGFTPCFISKPGLSPYI